jgi:hypothetical protein
VTSGGQVLDSCRELRAQGATVAVVLCVIDRETGGADSLAREGLELRALFTRSDLEEAASDDPLVSPGATLVEIVEAVRALPYGRPSERTVEAMLRERRGTCSTKHLYLARTLAERFPETETEIVHRVYRLHRDRAAELYGETIAESVPADGLVDIHRYLRITINGHRHTLDATFSGEPWDGRSSLPLVCGEGDDFPGSEKPDEDKRDLEAQHCNPAVREPFIAALATQPEGGVRGWRAT